MDYCNMSFQATVEMRNTVDNVAEYLDVSKSEVIRRALRALTDQLTDDVVNRVSKRIHEVAPEVPYPVRAAKHIMKDSGFRLSVIETMLGLPDEKFRLFVQMGADGKSA